MPRWVCGSPTRFGNGSPSRSATRGRASLQITSPAAPRSARPFTPVRASPRASARRAPAASPRFVAHDGVDGGEGLEHLAVREGGEVTAHRDVTCEAGFSQRRCQRPELLRAKLERHRHADHVGPIAQDRREHSGASEADRTWRTTRGAPGFERGREVAQRQVLFELGTDQEYVHGGLVRSRKVCATRHFVQREIPRRGRRMGRGGVSSRREQGACPAGGRPRQVSSFALSVIGVADSAFDSGQPFFAPSASAWNFAASTRGTRASSRG